MYNDPQQLSDVLAVVRLTAVGGGKNMMKNGSRASLLNCIRYY
jgi:hypothetical protein